MGREGFFIRFSLFELIFIEERMGDGGLWTVDGGPWIVELKVEN